MGFRYVTAKQVVIAHRQLLKTYGGLGGGGHRGDAYEGVEAAVRAVENSYYTNVYELAAAYAVYIVQGHVFLDGNKRAAGFAMLSFLQVNGVRSSIKSTRVAALMVELQKRSERGEGTSALIQHIVGCLQGRGGKHRR